MGIEQKINNNDSSKSENEYEINQLVNNIFQFKDYEWYYAVNDGLTQADDPCIMVLNGHSSSVNSVCYSPDGKTLASGSYDGTVRIWDVMSGECVSTESTLPVSFITSSTPLPYDGSRDLCVDVISGSEVSVTHSSATFYNNIVLLHRMNM